MTNNHNQTDSTEQGFKCKTRFHNIPPCSDCSEVGYCIGAELAEKRAAQAAPQQEVSDEQLRNERDDLRLALQLLAKVYDAMGGPRGPARIMADAYLGSETPSAARAALLANQAHRQESELTAEQVDRARKLTLDYAIATFDAMNGRMVNTAFVVQRLEELKSLPLDVSVITGGSTANGGQPSAPAEPVAWIERRYANGELVLETVQHQKMPEDQQAALRKHYDLEIVPLYAAHVAAPVVPDTDRKDAERYRWLKTVGWRHGIPNFAGSEPVFKIEFDSPNYGWNRGDDNIDDAIDAAISAAKNPERGSEG